MAGRLFAVLLLSEKSQLSAEELSSMLHASRGSISNTTRMLIQLRLLKRVSVHGDRRQYYQLSNPTALLETGSASIQHFRALLDRAMENSPEESVHARQRIGQYQQLYEFFHTEYASILKRWNEAKKQL